VSQRGDEVAVLEAPHHDAEIARTICGVPAFVEEPADAQSMRDPPIRKRTYCESALYALVLVGFGLREALTVEHAAVHFAEAVWQWREVARAEVA